MKPWAIISMAVAAAIAVVLWNRMVGTDKGCRRRTGGHGGDADVRLPEPYSAVLILLGVPMLATVLYALRGRSRLAGGVVDDLRGGTSWAAVAASGLFLGVCAMFYTLYAGLFAFVACLLALYLAGRGGWPPATPPGRWPRCARPGGGSSSRWVRGWWRWRRCRGLGPDGVGAVPAGPALG